MESNRATKTLVRALSSVLVALMVYYSTLGFLPAQDMRYGFVTAMLLVGFVLYRAKRRKVDAQREDGVEESPSAIPWYDVPVIVMVLATMAYLWMNWQSIADRYAAPLTLDVVAAVAIVLLVLELCRRTVGMTLVVVVLCAIAYAFLGRWIPGDFAHRGYDLTRVATTLGLSDNGMFGFLLQTMVSIIFVFVVFGAILERTGAGDWFIRVALSLAGRLTAGPAMAAVIGSALFGSINGMGAANVAATGVVSIPLMKRRGYRPEVAAGIEAAASTGGQLLPPVMGSVGFILAEYVGIPYVQVALYAFIPALLYFLGVLVYVLIQAKKLRLEKIETADIPGFWATVGSGWWHLAPMVVVTSFLLLGFSVRYCGIAGIAAALFANLLSGRERRIGLRDLVDACETGVRNSIAILVAILCAGMILGIVTLTGAGFQLTNGMLELVGGRLFLALMLIFLVSLVLGMGLPVVASYILVAPFAAPVLAEMGVPLLAAHFFILWASVDSNVTPPVAVTSYIAGAIAKADLMRSSWESWKAAKGLYLIPLFMVYSGLLFTEGVPQAIEATVACAISLIALTALSQRFLLEPLQWWEVLILALGVSVSFIPATFNVVVAAAAFSSVVISQVRKHKRATTILSETGPESSPLSH